MEKLLSTLELLSGGSQVMSTDQLAKCLSMNPKVISRMRQEGRFPIPHKTIGTKIAYSILAVAKYLFSDELEQKTEPPPKKTKAITPEKRRVTSKKALMPDLSRKMLMQGFLSALEQQKERIESTMLFFDRKIKFEDLRNELKNEKKLLKNSNFEKI